MFRVFQERLEKCHAQLCLQMSSRIPEGHLRNVSVHRDVSGDMAQSNIMIQEVFKKLGSVA